MDNKVENSLPPVEVEASEEIIVGAQKFFEGTSTDEVPLSVRPARYFWLAPENSEKRTEAFMLMRKVVFSLGVKLE